MFSKKSLLLIIILIGVLMISAAAFAEYGLEETAGAAGLLEKSPKDLPTLIGNVIGTLLSLIAVIFFALMIYGGFMWMTAHGKEEQAKKALETILAAVVGIIIVLASYAITTFVFKSVGGGGGGGGTTPVGDGSQEMKWCLTAEKKCVQGAGGPCSGQLFSDEAACKTAISGGGSGGSPVKSCKPQIAKDLAGYCTVMKNECPTTYCTPINVTKDCKPHLTKDLEQLCAELKSETTCEVFPLNVFCSWE